MSTRPSYVFWLVLAILVSVGVTRAQDGEHVKAPSLSQSQQHDHGAGRHSESKAGHSALGHTTESARHDEDNHDHESAGHNHATDHGQGSVVPPAVSYLGKFHPMVVHFPIALLLAAALSEVIGAVRKQERVSVATHYCLLLGTMSAVAGAALGWANAWGTQYSDAVAGFQVLTVHRVLGTAVALASVVCLAVAVRAQRSGDRSTVTLFRVALLMTAVLVGAAGHFGAMLVFGLDYFNV